MTYKEFTTRWLKRFASGIPAKKIQQYVVDTGNYIWHVFSWRLLPDGSFLEGEAARLAYDQAEKQDAIYVDAFAEDDCSPLPRELSHAAALDRFAEVYVTAADFDWTYIKTHESTCGPYFCRSSDSSK